MQAENVTEFVCRYMMDNKDYFPNWRNDVRNILTLFFHRTSVCPKSAGEVYSGAWAFPESAGCCGRSLWYGPMELAVPMAQYAVETGSPWAREIARRMQILATYDGHETGVSEDNIDGGFVVNADWFKIAHPMALKHLLGTIAWMPEEFAPVGENHIVRSTAVVDRVNYGCWGPVPLIDGVAYRTWDAPSPTITVLRLASEPKYLMGTHRVELALRADLAQNGYMAKPLGKGDWLVTVRHDGLTFIFIALDSSETSITHDLNTIENLKPSDKWVYNIAPPLAGYQWAQDAGATASVKFRGNQVRLYGAPSSDGGLADVYLDGVRQLAGIDCWGPTKDGAATVSGILYQRSGLRECDHTLKIVALGKRNPRSTSDRVYLSSAESSAATATPDSGEGRGPTDVQRWVFGYPGREDLKDSADNLWRPATEWIVRTGTMTDSVAASWWTTPCTEPIAGTNDPQLYRYGAHAKEFTANVTVGPGTYYVRLKFAATRGLDTRKNCVTVEICGKRVLTKLDVAAKAGGPNKALDLVFTNIAPRNGIINVRFLGGDPDKGIPGEAFVQALEIAPAVGGTGATPSPTAR